MYFTYVRPLGTGTSAGTISRSSDWGAEWLSRSNGRVASGEDMVTRRHGTGIFHGDILDIATIYGCILGVPALGGIFSGCNVFFFDGLNHQRLG